MRGGVLGIEGRTTNKWSQVRGFESSCNFVRKEQRIEKNLSVGTGKSHWRRKLSTVDLHVLTCLDLLLFILNILFTFFNETSYLNEEVKSTERSPSVSVPWWGTLKHCKDEMINFLLPGSSCSNGKVPAKRREPPDSQAGQDCRQPGLDLIKLFSVIIDEETE